MALIKISNRTVVRSTTTFNATVFFGVRKFSVLNRPAPNYEGHVPLNGLEKSALAIGSAFMALRDPYRHGKETAGRSCWLERCNVF